ncbi:hypothetical protein ABL78_0700 [Leptomonas seymouri]|uniref:C3H1-type domain-containing protein n=1 Tax=Leptomonas seymouri TaxID=5684 RepID=A0A0N1IMF1_LEPSE|nr:hypothetical protein ABL78_0700 [Leptomonas seymouri]|eukprot:KPI90182.1 hypothetical protein ABL78_0700 [Leptomonas seymouri]
MLSSQELENLLQHTKYDNSYDDTSDGDQEKESPLPMCLATPLLLNGDDDSSPRTIDHKLLPFSSGHQEEELEPQQSGSREKLPFITTGTKGDLVSQEESNASDSLLAMQICRLGTPPPYAPASSNHAAAEVDYCSAIEKAKMKTVMCLNYMHRCRCRFGSHCAFAHGVEELRPAPPEMMAKKHAIASSNKPLLTETSPPSYREALAAPPVESPELGATPAYEDAVREQGEHLPPPLPTDALPPMLAHPILGMRQPLSSKQSSGFPIRQRPQGSGGNARLMKSQQRRVKRPPV